MAHVSRVAAVLPLFGAVAAAAALTGAAVFTVSQAACPNPGHYVQEGVTLHLVGGCVSRDELPSAPQSVVHAAQVGGVTGHGVNSQARRP
ncbi:MAG TPA: hypothetical protein VJX10_12715 [Pseudonocardiaceae bacterium]|nr:hypothetical protein [Pseudonocardiaceae bacterium]